MGPENLFKDIAENFPNLERENGRQVAKVTLRHIIMNLSNTQNNEFTKTPGVGRGVDCNLQRNFH